MNTSFASSLDALGAWRRSLLQKLADLTRFLADHELVDDARAAQLAMLRERLSNEKLVLAFVAEFSRGKSELINAIFFADTGRRVLPATPGRTTMCPVELAWDDQEAPSLALLPIDTRLDGLSLSELRIQPRAWTRRPLVVRDADQLAQALTEVMRTQWVTQTQARALGFWDDAHPDDNPPLDEAGRVEVPVWRHALINYPHPLLKQGLVVLDTPGLNALGAEPELTLSLLPLAHATVFLLGADTGVTKSDLAIWRDHLSSQSPTRFVVLNKIDAMVDPLALQGQVQAQIDAQRSDTARLLGMPIERVFPLSARDALAGRISGDAALLARSRLPELETALGEQLLPQRRHVLEQLALEGAAQVEAHIGRQLGEARRQLAEQMLELRGLRGKSSAKVRLMLQRVDAEMAEFEQCTARLQALRTVHGRMLKDTLALLSTERLRDEVGQMQSAMNASLLKLGARKSFVALCERLRGLLAQAEQGNVEVRDMLEASFGRLNAEFGFSLAVARDPEFERYADELTLIETSYAQYLGLTQALRLVQPKFMEQFRRMLVSKLRVVFENATGEIELWNKAVSTQVDAQLRERRKSFRRRREALERIQIAATELEQRIGEIEAQDREQHQVLARAGELMQALRQQARAQPTVEVVEPAPLPMDGLISLHLPESDEPVPMLLRHARA